MWAVAKSKTFYTKRASSGSLRRISTTEYLKRVTPRLARFVMGGEFHEPLRNLEPDQVSPRALSRLSMVAVGTDFNEDYLRGPSDVIKQCLGSGLLFSWKGFEREQNSDVINSVLLKPSVPLLNGCPADSTTRDRSPLPRRYHCPHGRAC